MIREDKMSPFAGLPASERLRQLSESCSRGLALGIVQEVYLAQFMLLHAMVGDDFLATPAARLIIDRTDMTWREKMFQLIALTGADVSQGALPVS
jgi:hypothetical protein